MIRLGDGADSRPAPPEDRSPPDWSEVAVGLPRSRAWLVGENEGQGERAPTRLIDLRGLLTGSDASCGAQNRMFPGWGRPADAAVPFVGRLAVFRFSVA
jgi:hypothetical protein